MMNPFDKITAGDKKPRKAIKRMTVDATDNGRHVVTHEHHHPQHHRNATHAMSSIEELAKHMTENAPKIEAQEPSMDEAQAAPAGEAESGAAAALMPPQGQ